MAYKLWYRSHFVGYSKKSYEQYQYIYLHIFLTNRPEILLKLVGSASSSTQSGVQAREVLITTHLDKAVHVVCGKADEVKVALAATHDQVLQLQVYITDARIAVGHVRG